MEGLQNSHPWSQTAVLLLFCCLSLSPSAVTTPYRHHHRSTASLARSHARGEHSFGVPPSWQIPVAQLVTPLRELTVRKAWRCGWTGGREGERELRAACLPCQCSCCFLCTSDHACQHVTVECGGQRFTLAVFLNLSFFV